jgi:hypothetical protein
MLGAKTLMFCPLGYNLTRPERSVDWAAGYGLTDQVELLASIATPPLGTPVSYGGSWLMGRYAVRENHIGALQVYYDTDAWGLVPQYHFFTEKKYVDLELNAGLDLPVQSPADGTLFMVFAPVYKAIPDRVHTFIEHNTGLALQGDLSFSLAPGIWLGSPSGAHSCAISFPIVRNENNRITLTMAAWYCLYYTLGATP